ncbi:hypothetical protein Pla8534_18360 [Lignipirellula cremea]|uniref:Uncharacterized protein n=1 Tax=Lignipirellula cremea TaxID=2528010 RepID=A0A518DQD4_9BACT|nr:hypothetical protein Pla8534_18360 [Lignipirellula cremea]
MYNFLFLAGKPVDLLMKLSPNVQGIWRTRCLIDEFSAIGDLISPDPLDSIVLSGKVDQLATKLRCGETIKFFRRRRFYLSE